MTRVTILASGTRGDVQPAIALGKKMQGAGYRVRLLASSHFREWIEGHGLEAAPAQVDIQAVMASEGGQEWVERGHNPLVQTRVMKRLLDKFGWRLVLEAWEACRGAEAIISSFTSDVYAVTIAERLQVPLLSMPLQPSLIATRDGRALPNAPLPNRVSRINEWFGRLIIEPFPWQLYGEHTNRLRRQLGLPLQSAAENAAARRRMCTLHAFSEHVVPRPADWPDHFHLTGYWFLDEEEGEWQPSPVLADFLAAGAPPVYIGFGSMTGRDAAAMTQLVVEAVQRAGLRAVLLSGWAGMGQVDLPDAMICLPRAPHSWLFPRMTAVVHHGGAGTTAVGLRAGVPTVVVPHMVDQPYWGQRAHNLGVGPAPIPRHKLTAAKLAAAMRQAVEDPAIRRRAATLGEKIRAEDGLSRALAIIDRVVTHHESVPA